MTYADLANPGVHHLPVYEPGRPIERVARDFGLDPRTVAKLASNENPLGCSPRALDAARQAMERISEYPDGGAVALREAIAAHLELAPEQVLPGNGSNEIIELLGHAFLRPGVEVVMGSPAFVVYKLVTLLFGAAPVEVPLVNFTHDLTRMRQAVTDRTRLVFLPSPNNPTGTCNEARDIRAFARDLPDSVIFVFDEAYSEYLESPPDLRDMIGDRPLLCLRTFSKIHGLAGFRLGYGYGDSTLIQFLQQVRQPFNTNAPAQAAAIAALNDPDWVRSCRKANLEGLAWLSRELGERGYTVTPSRANFLLVEFSEARTVFEALQRKGLIVRPLAGYGLPDHLRISVGTPEQNARLMEVLDSWAAPPGAGRRGAEGVLNS